MEAIAISKFVRQSPRKVNQILGLIRNKSVSEAFNILKIVNKRPKILISKTLKSAIANAGRLKKMDGMVIRECYVGQGPSMKRWRARAFGRAVQYKHRTCHLTIKVGEKTHTGAVQAQMTGEV
ncbi:MAG: 50S ribosomal protein L22 [Elusimicrobiota bacterium]